MDFLAADISPGQRGWFARIGRRWWIVAIGMVLGLVVGERYLAVTPKTYSSAASVDIQLSQAVVAQAKLRTTAMTNELVWAQSAVVAQRAKTLLHWTADLTTLQTQATEVIPTNSQLISFTFAGNTPLQAQNGAEAFAEAFVQERDGLRSADQARREADLTTQKAAADADVQKYTAMAANNKAGTSAHDQAASELIILRNQENLLNLEQTDITLSGSGVAQIVDNAPLPTAPSKPVALLILPAGLLLGLILSGTIAVLLARRDRRVRVPADVTTWAGLTLVGTIKGRGRAAWAVAVVPERATRAAFDSLRVRMWQFATGGTPGIAALVPTPRSDGATFTAVNLAASLSRQGVPVVLVCADGGSATPQALQVSAQAGLSDLLRGSATLDAVVTPVAGLPGVGVLTPGADIDEVLREIPRPVLAAFLQELTGRGSYVLVEAPAATAGVTGLEVARLADAVVLVAEVGTSRTPDLERAADELDLAGSRIFGVFAVPRLVSQHKRPWTRSSEPGHGDPADRTLETQAG